jgi:protocatechuate 3,4-dioxygenase beta subunit
MKRKIVSIVVFLTLVLTAFAIVPTRVKAEGDFGIAAFPSSQTVNPGGSATFVVTVTSIDGFDSPVTLSVTGLPDGATASFNPNPVIPTGNSILTITTTYPGTPTGSFPITVTGTSGELTHNATTAITVDFGLIPKQFGTFAGRVTDADTGEPIAGAKVFVCSDSWYYQYYYTIYPSNRYYYSPAIPEVTTDSNGNYTITGVPLNDNNAPKDWRVGFYANGYSGTYTVATATADTITTVDMELCHASFTGRVTDLTTGEPIAGAEIWAWSYIPNSYGYVYSFHTNETGFYILPNLPLANDNEPRAYSVRVSAPGYSNDLGETQTTTISCGENITLNFPLTFGTFAGQVTDAETGLPIAGAKVFVSYYYYYYIYPWSRSWNKVIPEVTTDSNGYYTITGVPLSDYNNPRNWIVGFDADNHSSTFHIATAIADTITTVDMALCHASITGRITNSNNDEPIAGAQIRALFNGYYSGFYLYEGAFSFTSDEQGFYTLYNLPLDHDNELRSYNVQISAAGYYDQTQTPTISCGSIITQDFSLVPKLFGTFTGQVTDANTGDPIAGAKVFVCSNSQYYYYLYPSSRSYYNPEIPQVTTDSNGNYTITGVPLNDNNAPKDWVVGFYADEYSGTYTVATATADTITTVNMTLCHAGIIGRVIDATTGEPIAGAKIEAWSYASYSYGYVYSFYTDETGFYNLPNLPLANDNEPRSYYVRASAQGYYDQTKSGTIFCGGIITIDFAGEIAFGTIAGTVTSCITGQPMEGVFIGSSFGGFDYTDEMGMYTLTNVPLEVDGSPRTWEVTARAGGGYEDQTESVEVSADTTSILDFILCFNRPPVAVVNGPYTGFEGSSIAFSATGSSDPDGDLLTYSWDLNGDGIYGDATGPTPSNTWYDDYFGTISVKVYDGQLADTDSTTVTIYNVAPNITSLTVSPCIVPVGKAVTLDATFTDPGTLDTHTATIDWGDETSDGTVNGYTVTGTHTYNEAGVYTVTLTVTDDDGGSDTEIFQYVVIYNPAVSIDIKPGSCPNPINYKDNGLLPIAVCGTEDFDVTTIDPASIRLRRNGVVNSVEPVRWSYEDAATPYTGNEGCSDCCGCHTLTGDGYMDLLLKFKIQDVIKNLSLVLDSRETIPLTITGILKEEYYSTPIEGQDCVLVLFSKNVGIIDIISPTSGVPQTFTPEVTVKNYGSKKENNVPVNLVITTAGVTEYNKTVYVNINMGETLHVLFPNWTPIGGEGDIDYTITACTKLKGDEKPSNDCMSKVITLHYPYLHDVGVTEIISPTSGPSQTFTPEVIVKNFGQYDETFNLNVQIQRYLTPTNFYSYGWEDSIAPIYPHPVGTWNVINQNFRYSTDYFWTRYSGSTYAHTGTYSAAIYTYSTYTPEDYLVTPQITVAADTVFSFWSRSYSTSYPLDDLQVSISTTGNSCGTMFTIPVDNIIDMPITYVLHSYNLATYVPVGTQVYVAISSIALAGYRAFIDDLLLMNGATTVWSEGFEVAWTPASTTPAAIPPGWTNQIQSGTYSWAPQGAGYLPLFNGRHEGQYMVFYNSYSASSGYGCRIYMNSNPINFAATGLSQIIMKIWNYKYTSGADMVYVEASTDMVNWVVCGSFNHAATPAGWAQNTVDLSAFAASNTVYLAFRSVSSYGYNMYLDDFALYASGLVPAGYNQIISVANLASMETRQITCPNWLPAEWHNPAYENIAVVYNIVATTQLGTDLNPANDMKAKDFTLTYPYLHDLQVLSIDSPITSGPAVESYPVKITVKNIGQYPERGFFSNVKITGAVVKGYDSSFETNNGGFAAGGGTCWAWGVPTSGPMAAHEGTKLWATNLAGNYPAGHYWLDSPVISVPVGEDLTWWQWFYMETSYDGGNIKISTDGGTTWTLLTPVGGYTGTANSANPLYPEAIYTGSYQSWAQKTIDLAAYEGQAVKFRFDFGADPSVNYAGWNIDQVKVGTVTLIPTIDAYDELAPVSTYIYPGETRQLTFPDFEPANMSIGISGTVTYTVVGDSALPGDTYTANDIGTASFQLTYIHE